MGSDGKFFQKADSSSIRENQSEVPQLGAIEALEAYSSEHPETIEELKNWYWKKFEVLFAAYMKRKAVQEATDVKNAMISGLWSNSNYDDNKNTRQKALIDIENNYQQAINMIYNKSSQLKVDYGDQIDKDDPFYAAMNTSDYLDAPVLDRTTEE